MDTQRTYTWTEIARDGTSTKHSSTEPADAPLDGLTIRHDRPCYVTHASVVANGQAEAERVRIYLSEQDREFLRLQSKRSNEVVITSEHQGSSYVFKPLTTEDFTKRGTIEANFGNFKFCTCFNPDCKKQKLEEDPTAIRWRIQGRKQMSSQLRGAEPLLQELDRELGNIKLINRELTTRHGILDSSCPLPRDVFVLMQKACRHIEMIHTALDGLVDCNMRLEILVYTPKENNPPTAESFLASELEQLNIALTTSSTSSSDSDDDLSPSSFSSSSSSSLSSSICPPLPLPLSETHPDLVALEHDLKAKLRPTPGSIYYNYVD